MFGNYLIQGLSKTKGVGEGPVWRGPWMWKRVQMVEPWGHHRHRGGGRRKQVRPKRVVPLKPRQEALVSNMSLPELR